METTNKTFDTKASGLLENVLTKDDQDQLTPDAVLELLKQGNQRFVGGEMTLRNHNEQVKRAIAGQFPKAVVLGCVDSRVPVETIFDLGIGDMFVARVAGNFVNTDILGSMEFACKVSGSKLVVVLGHESCGAVKGAIDDVELGNITAMLAKIKPAIESINSQESDKSSSNAALVHQVAERNVALNVERVRAESPVLRELEEAGEIKIVGAMYSLQSGEVTFLDA